MNIAKIVSKLASLAILVAILMTSLGGCFGSLGMFDNKAKILEEAEERVNQSVYTDLGIVAECFDSEIIYEEDGEYLVAVRYGLDSRDWDGCYCVHMNGEYAVGCTTMLPSGYDFDERLEELKALFGI